MSGGGRGRSVVDAIANSEAAMTLDSLRSDARLLLAAERAVDVGADILRRGRSHIGALIAKGDRDFATDIDLQIETAIRTALGTATSEIPFLGEEGGGDQRGAQPRWVLDPIDGTINFAKDSPLCAVSLSLVADGQPLLGIVDMPLLGERFIARAGQGAYLNGVRIAITDYDGSPHDGDSRFTLASAPSLADRVRTIVAEAM